MGQPQAAQAGMSGEGRDVADAWQFDWAETPPVEAFARVTGRLNWRGFDIDFALDALTGVDGRLSGPSLGTLPAGLQQLVLSHCAQACLDAFDVGPWAGTALVAIDWHDTPVTARGDFEFTVRRPGVRGSSVGWLSVPRDAARRKLMAALVMQRWPLPPALASIDATLVLGTAHLTDSEIDGLEAGDIVWVDGAELAPAGLHVHIHTGGDAAPRSAWLKRSELRLDDLPQGRMRPDVDTTPIASDDGLRSITVASPTFALSRAWWLGGAPVQRLDRPVTGIVWQLVLDGLGIAEGSVVVVGRRVGLRLMRRLTAASASRDAALNDGEGS